MSINNFNASSFNRIVEEEKTDEIAHSGMLYAYIATLVFRLRALFIKSPAKADSVVLIKCFINDILYKKDIITSLDRRFKAIPFSSNTIPDRLKSYKDSKNKVNSILICDGMPLHINLRTIHAGLEQTLVLYESFVRKQFEESKKGGFMEALVKTASNTSAFENMVDTNYTCYTAIPEIDELKWAVGEDKDESVISWFEPYDKTKADRYKIEARKARMIYMDHLEKLNASNAKKRAKVSK